MIPWWLMITMLYRCHPNYRGDGPWYDWVMMSYEDENDPGVPLTGPARLIAIVVDSTDPDQKYQPIIQWGGDETNKNSVLFMEFELDLMTWMIKLTLSLSMIQIQCLVLFS